MIITEFYEETKAIKTAAIEAVEIFIRVVIYLRLLPKIVINKKNNKVIYKSSVITKVSWPQKAWDWNMESWQEMHGQIEFDVFDCKLAKRTNKSHCWTF